MLQKTVNVILKSTKFWNAGSGSYYCNITSTLGRSAYYLSPERIAIAEPKVVPLFLLMFYPLKGTEGGPIVFTYVLFCVIGNVYWTSNLVAVFFLFGTLKMFYCDGTGRTGRDGQQKCPSIFFILCG